MVSTQPGSEGKTFNTSSKLVYQLGVLPEDNLKPLHPKVEKEAAEQLMMGAVERMHKWKE